MPLSDIKVELQETIKKLEHILYDELLLGLSDVPTYDISSLFDNNDDDRVGFSLLDNFRNRSLPECHRWLVLDGACADPRLKSEIWHENNNVRPSFAKHYESVTQAFLKELLVAMHKGSGQPARRTEVLTITWENTEKGLRDLTILLNELSFTIPYHKSRTRTHRSRYPVRFPLKIVQHILLQYMALVLPMRAFSIFGNHDTCS